jgi:hypothetical protein
MGSKSISCKVFLRAFCCEAVAVLVDNDGGDNDAAGDEAFCGFLRTDLRKAGA